MEEQIILNPENQENIVSLNRENITISGGGGAVDSVNGQTGDVVLTTSDLENTSDYQTGSDVESTISSAIAVETENRQIADNGLQTQIDAITASSDVTDIVGTYADLEAYDTTHLNDNDIIKVLQDETHDDETTYYRWNKHTETFSLIGEEGPYYTKAQTDLLLGAKQNNLTAGANITIDANNEISATNTTYSNFVGTDGQAAGTSGLVPGPTTSDTNKFLKSDGTWDSVAAGPTVVQTTGTSQTDVMSQNATTSMVFADPSTKMKPQIGSGAAASGTDSVALGRNAKANTIESVCIGKAAGNGSNNISRSVNIGTNAGYQISENISGSISLGAYSKASRTGELNIGSTNTSYGYNSTNYRVIGGVHDPVNAQDAATKNYVDSLVGNIESALNIINNGGSGS